jgi:hypothetical protein
VHWHPHTYPLYALGCAANRWKPPSTLPAGVSATVELLQLRADRGLHGPIACGRPVLHMPLQPGPMWPDIARVVGVLRHEIVGGDPPSDFDPEFVPIELGRAPPILRGGRGGVCELSVMASLRWRGAEGRPRRESWAVRTRPKVASRRHARPARGRLPAPRGFSVGRVRRAAARCARRGRRRRRGRAQFGDERSRRRQHLRCCHRTGLVVWEAKGRAAWEIPWLQGRPSPITGVSTRWPPRLLSG